MQRVMLGYVRAVDCVNYRVGRMVMYGIFVLMGVLLWSTISKAFSVPSLWTLEMAQFVMVAYFIVGGPYSIQMGSNVRMDLLYGSWSPRRKAWFDVFTTLLLIFYICVLIYGAVASTAYSLGYWGTEPFGFFAGLVTGAEEVGRLEQSSSVWRPYMWPVKAVMLTGLILMLLQCVSEFLKNVLRLRGVDV